MKIKNIEKWIVFLAIAVVISVTMKSSADRSMVPDLPNILWLVSEDNSPFFGCYGDEFATTPNLDQLAAEGIRYTRAFANAPVCAPARFTIITGCYPTSCGTQHMRSIYPIPEEIKFFPQYLRLKGYYCTNCSKEDYNTIKPDGVWDESSPQASYRNRGEGQPFFHVQNFSVSHESSIHRRMENLRHNRDSVKLPPYHPDTEEIRYDWAQYYDKITELDRQVGEFLEKLEKEGLAENTIVIYYADHGGVLARSKRYLYETGTRVPMIVRFPEKFRHMAPGSPGSKSERLVSFVDLAPTVLSLTGIQIPEYMQGDAFLGEQTASEPAYVFLVRGRMDERYDMSRAIRDRQYRYIRNYMPYRIYGQHLEYLWRAPSCRSWEEEYLSGRCNEIQSIFWEPKPAEELYDLQRDPWEVDNLANDPDYNDVLIRMRKDCDRKILETYDSGFLPEPGYNDISDKSTMWEYVRSENYPREKVLALANRAIENNPDNLPFLIEKLKEKDGILRFWAATGLLVLGKNARTALPHLREIL
ncbi:MAG: sulfatase, partial [Bacteroidales bacterium]